MVHRRSTALLDLVPCQRHRVGGLVPDAAVSLQLRTRITAHNTRQDGIMDHSARDGPQQLCYEGLCVYRAASTAAAAMERRIERESIHNSILFLHVMSPDFDFDFGSDTHTDSGYWPRLECCGISDGENPSFPLAGHGAEKCAEQRQYVHTSRKLFYFLFQVLFVCHLIFSASDWLTDSKAAGPGNSHTREVLSCYEKPPPPSVPRHRLDPDTLVPALFCADDSEHGSFSMALRRAH